MKIAIALPAAVGLLILGQTAEATEISESMPYVEAILHGGAVGVLGWVAWQLLGMIKEQRKEFTETIDKVMERHERWETKRHEDSERLDSTLRVMTENCAKSRDALAQRNRDGQ